MGIFEIKWFIRSIILLLVILISACSIGPYTQYFASETEFTLLRSNTPVPFTQISREVKRDGARRTKERQIAVTDENGIARFEDVTVTGMIKWASVTTYVSNYYIKSDSTYYFIGDYNKLLDSRYSDITFWDSKSTDTVLVWECDLDSNIISRINIVQNEN